MCTLVLSYSKHTLTEQRQAVVWVELNRKGQHLFIWTAEVTRCREMGEARQVK